MLAFLAALLLLPVLSWADVSASVLKVQHAGFLRGGGTGFVLATSKGRVVVTNAHVCSPDSSDFVLKRGSNIIRTYVLYVAKTVDLCILHYPSSLRMRGLKLKNLEQVKVAGHPRLGPLKVQEGLVVDYSPWGNSYTRDVYLTGTLSFQIEPGSSGSPVVDEHDQVIGVVYAYNTQSRVGYFIHYVELMRTLNEAGLL